MAVDYRLKREKDFNLVFSKGKRIFSEALTLVYLPAGELKCGYAVSKKHGGSVQRNRLKRLMRESFRSFAPYLRKNFFFVFIPKIKEHSFEEIKKSMEYIFRKGNFFQENPINETDA